MPGFKVNLYVKYALALATTILLSLDLKAATPGDALVTVTQLSDSEILVNRWVLRHNGNYEMIGSYPARTLDRPWSEKGARIRFSPSELANEQLKKINPPKNEPLISASSFDKIAAITKDYDVDIKKSQVCNLNMDKALCGTIDKMYYISFAYKHEF